MKRCPECRRDYFDDSLLYCLDDGAQLLEGPKRLDPQSTVRLGPPTASEAPTRRIDDVTQEFAGANSRSSSFRRWPRAVSVYAVIAILAVVAGSVWFLAVYKRAPTPTVPPGSFRSADSPAYDFYLRGKIDASSYNRERNENAIKVLREVVAADPGFAPAYAELARAYGIKADRFTTGEEQRKLYYEAKLAVERALALEPNLAMAHFVRGALIWNPVERFPHAQAVMSLKRAVAIDPNLAEAHTSLGQIYTHIGLFDEGEQALQRAIEIDPSNALARARVAVISDYRLELEKAMAILRTVPRDSGSTLANRTMAAILFRQGKIAEAESIIDGVLAAGPDEGGNVTSVRAMMLAKAGKANEAETTIRRAIEIGQSYQHFHHTTYNIASAYAMLGKNDEALKWLEFTADNGFPCYPFFEKDPHLNNLRTDERFVTLMTRLREQWEQYMANL